MLLIKANLALPVAVPPKSTSKVLLEGDIALLFNCQKLDAAEEQLDNEGVDAPDTKQSPEVEVDA